MFALLGLLIGCGGDDGGGQVDAEVRIPSEGMLPTYRVGDILDVALEPDSVAQGDVVTPLSAPSGGKKMVGGRASA